MTPAETAAQLRLAADILETGHPWEYRPYTAPQWIKSFANCPLQRLANNCEIRPILARPPYKAELHNPDGLTAEQVGVGYRLLLASEVVKSQEWEDLDFFDGSKWVHVLFTSGKRVSTYRLPLSAPWPEKPKSAELTPELAAKGYEQYGFGPGITVVEKPDPYAELKKAHAERKVIQINLGSAEKPVWDDLPAWYEPAFNSEVSDYRIKPDEIPWIEWKGGECPLKDEEVEEWEYRLRDGTLLPSHCDVKPSGRLWWHNDCESDIIAYRVLKWREKKPKVPLGPSDVPPCSAVRGPSDGAEEYALVCGVGKHGIILSDGRVVTFDHLRSGWLINRSIPLTGKWDANAWEKCEK